jgi:hypothetical protein
MGRINATIGLTSAEPAHTSHAGFRSGASAAVQQRHQVRINLRRDPKNRHD